jgi:TRAP-type C4-dicarboxylate transport system permease small subunit
MPLAERDDGASAAAARVLRRVLRALDRLSGGMAYAGGAVLLAASFYITLDVLGRRFAGMSSGATDEFGGYALAVGGIWALAFALTTDSHVRIDVLLPRLPPRLRACLDYAAMAAMAFFAAVVAYYSWKLAIESLLTDARAMSFLRTPLFLPQGCLAIGFSAMAVHAATIFLLGVAESAHGRRFAPLPVLRAHGVTEGL